MYVISMVHHSKLNAPLGLDTRTEPRFWVRRDWWSMNCDCFGWSVKLFRLICGGRRVKFYSHWSQFELSPNIFYNVCFVFVFILQFRGLEPLGPSIALFLIIRLSRNRWPTECLSLRFIYRLMLWMSFFNHLHTHCDTRLSLCLDVFYLKSI